MVSVIIPSFYSEDAISGLLKDLRQQTIKRLEVLLVYRVKPSGRARNLGAAKSIGDFLVFMDDDIRLGDENVVANLIEPLKRDTSIGLTGASIRTPPGANRFQQRVAAEIPRLEFPIVEKPVDSDMVTTQCWAQRRDCFLEIGPFSEIIDRGVDPEYRRRVRRKGLRTIIVPHTWSYHPPPVNLSGFLRQNFRNGRYSANAQRRYPHLVVPVPDSGEIDEIIKRSLGYRIFRGISILFKSLFSFKFCQLIERLSYAGGYIVGRVERLD